MPNPNAILLEIWQMLESRAAYHGQSHVSVVIPYMPMSLNHQYRRGKGGTSQVYLKDEVKAFREAAAYCCLGKKFEPKGMIEAIVELHCPEWIMKRGVVRKVDLDNMVKGIFDALEKPLGFRDHMIWQFHAFKIYSIRRETVVHLYDMGTIAGTS